MENHDQFEAINAQELIHIYNCIRQFRTSEAFWAAADGVEASPVKQGFLLRILSRRDSVAHLRNDYDRIRQLAEQGNPYMQYALARLNDCVPAADNAPELKKRYYTLAMEAGIADARACLALCWRDGDFGESDPDRYEAELSRALDEGSDKAAQLRMNNMIHGWHGCPRDPQAVCDMIEDYLDGLQEYEIDPYYFALLGDADKELGRTGAAAADYKKAIAYGDRSAFFSLGYTTCFDLDDNLADREEFFHIMKEARAAGAVDGYVAAALLLNDETFDAMSDQEQKTTHDLLDEELRIAIQMGDAVAAEYLGSYYEFGSYGFRQDDAEAWACYSTGSTLQGGGSCFRHLGRMVLEEHTAPAGIDAEYGYECYYRALLQNIDTLADVIHGYKTGHLARHAEMIESTFLPEYESQCGEILDDHDEDLDDDGYDDGHEYLFDGEPEREVGEDSWNVDPDVSLRCCGDIAVEAEKRVKAAAGGPVEMGDLLGSYLNHADRLISSCAHLDRLCRLNSRMLQCLTGHPHSRLHLLYRQRAVLEQIQSHDESALSQLEAVTAEIQRLDK